MAKKCNPYKPGTAPWHQFNLHGSSWEHVESFINVPSGLEATGLVYGPTTFLYDAQKASNGVRTLYEGQQLLLKVPFELEEACPDGAERDETVPNADET